MSVLSVCRSIRKITDEDLDEMEKVAKEQLSYFSPLKMATQGRQHDLGTHNLNVIKKLRELRNDIIKSAELAGRS